MNDSKSRLTRIFTVALAAYASLAAATSASGAVHDQISIYQHGGILVRATLPDGPVSPAVSVSHGIGNFLTLPSGQVLATTQTATTPVLTMLNELLPDGSLRQIGGIEPPPHMLLTFDITLDLTLDHRGRVFMVLFSVAARPHEPSPTRLIEIDPATGATLSSKQLVGVSTIATAPDGFWVALATGLLFKLNPDNGVVTPTGLALPASGNIIQIETDSAGRIWYIEQPTECSPLCNRLGFFDPWTGAAGLAPAALYQQTPAMHEIAIQRGCFESSTVRCLQGGRFRAEVEFTAYDGLSGTARVAPARSADTGVFSFFHPDNWELMVKVLDGCAINGHFWVYSSASTDVQFTMTVTDTQTGVEQVYLNRLGQVAKTVADGAAFSCSP
jgi:hypothetical protein